MGRPGRNGGIFSAVPTPLGIPAMVGAISDATYADYQTYMGAHSLLPPMPPWATSPKPVHIARAFGLMASPGTPSESRLWAIVVLGHTPQKNALDVLREHGRSKSRYAGVARLAADECAEWISLTEEAAAESRANRDAAVREGTDQANLERALEPEWTLRRNTPAHLLN